MVAKRHTETGMLAPPNDGIMELSILISRSQFDALEQVAQTAQMTVAQFLRRLVQSSIISETAGTATVVQ